MPGCELPLADSESSNCGGQCACGSPCAASILATTDSSQSHSHSPEPSDALLAPEDQVLSTLDKDGSRRWMKPRISVGKWFRRRQILAYVLMVIFVAIPHLRISGKPLIRLDIIAREFTFLGHTFLPTDTLLLALLMLSAFVGIVFLTTVMGRAWCGWACPQTVYIEFLFRPLDRLFEGTVGKGGKAKRELGFAAQVLRFVCYVVITSFLAHTFLAYFVGTEKLAEWLWGSPLNHPVAFAFMLTTTVLLTYDFFYFREQTCMIACPYGRFQSVMLDRQSLIVAYDDKRGEPRKKGKRTATSNAGDCVDCNRCVTVCPTGIDIRDGLQMECINCTQCIDACDDVMDKVGLPTGLIRYTSQEALDGRPWKLLRIRTIAYPILLAVLLTGFAFAVASKYSFDARIIRGKGAPFSLNVDGNTTNSFSMRIVNRSSQSQSYELSVVSPDSVSLEIIEPQRLNLDTQQSALIPFQLQFPTSLTSGVGNKEVTLHVKDQSGNERDIQFRIIGPR